MLTLHMTAYNDRLNIVLADNGRVRDAKTIVLPAEPSHEDYARSLRIAADWLSENK